jgi:hypothetical protein
VNRRETEERRKKKINKKDRKESGKMRKKG